MMFTVFGFSEESQKQNINVAKYNNDNALEDLYPYTDISLRLFNEKIVLCLEKSKKL